MKRPDSTLSYDDFMDRVGRAVMALEWDAPEALPKVEYPWNSWWPAAESPDFMWHAFTKWNRWANSWIRNRMDEPFIRFERERFQPPTRDVYMRWWEDVLYDQFLRISWDELRVLLFVAALRLDDAKWIAVTLKDVIDRAGTTSPYQDKWGRWRKKVPQWARIEAAWHGIRAVDEKIRDLDPIRDTIAYLRSYVAKDAGSRARRYGDERPDDPVRLADEECAGQKLKRVSAKLLPELPSSEGDVLQSLLSWEVERGRYEQSRAAAAELLRPGERKLLDLMEAENLPAAGAERRLGLPPGTWRNLLKRAKKAFPEKPDNSVT